MLYINFPPEMFQNDQIFISYKLQGLFHMTAKFEDPDVQEWENIGHSVWHYAFQRGAALPARADLRMKK